MMRASHRLPRLVLVLPAVTLACRDAPPERPTGPDETQWLELLSTGPSHGATGVARSVTVSATFSDVLDPASVNAGTFMLYRQATLVAVDIVVAGNIAWLDPRELLDLSTSYTARLTAEITDTAGHRIQRGHNWEFTTKLQ